jgi:hypothetical protein
MLDRPSYEIRPKLYGHQFIRLDAPEPRGIGYGIACIVLVAAAGIVAMMFLMVTP